MASKESLIQRRVINYFETYGYLVVKIIQTTKNGWPDLQCHRNGETIFVETKADNGVVSPLQFYRHNQLMKHGFKVYIIKNLNDLHSVKIS
jgi:hypothetical protein